MSETWEYTYASIVAVLLTRKKKILLSCSTHIARKLTLTPSNSNVNRLWSLVHVSAYTHTHTHFLYLFLL